MAKQYTDVDVVERTTITPEGLVKKLYRLSARTTSGTFFTVEIPEEDLDPEKVAEVLGAKAAAIEKIKGA